LQPFPWRLSYISSVHTHEYNDMNRVCKHTLVIHTGAGGERELVKERKTPRSRKVGIVLALPS
jgi:hypothetical protein